MKHFGDKERQVRHDDDHHGLHDAHVVCESCREGAGETHQSADADGADDDDEERHDAEHYVDGDDVLPSDLAHLAEHVIKHLQHETVSMQVSK